MTNAHMPAWANKRFLAWCIYLAMLCATFALPVREFATYTADSDVHSYVLLVPFVTAYLVYIRWRQLSRELTTSWTPAAALTVTGFGALVAREHFSTLGQNDQMTLVALSFVCFAITGAFLFLGAKWARSAMFPLFFLAFFIPLPEIVVDTL